MKNTMMTDTMEQGEAKRRFAFFSYIDATAMNRRNAFTLIELLTVVAIIAMLIAILMPSLRRSRMVAKRAICASHLHQQGVMLYAYAYDFRVKYPTEPTPNPSLVPDHWPIGGLTLDNNHDPAGWALLAAKGYADDPRVFYCPSARYNRASFEKSWHPQSDPDDWWQTLAEYAYWAGYRTEQTTPPNPDLYELIASSPTSNPTTLLSSDSIAWNNVQMDWYSFNNHYGTNGDEPEGGSVLANDMSVRWRDFNVMDRRLIRAGLQFWF